jgi:predicted nucleotidyltransferase
VKEALEEISRQYRLIAIYVFGSRSAEIAARLEGRPAVPEYPDSDVDIGILPERDQHLSVLARVEVMQGLEELFHVDRVDLIILPEASPFLALDVIRGELLFTLDPDAEAEFELYVLRRAGDLAGWEQERRRMILAGEAF